MAFMKAPAYEGRDLTVQLGRGDFRLLDGVKYTDERLRRYVNHGMVVEVSDDKKVPTVATTAQSRAAAVEKPVVSEPTPQKSSVEPQKSEPQEEKAEKPASEPEPQKSEPQEEKPVSDPVSDTKSADAAVARAALAGDGGSVSKSPASKMGSGASKTSTRKSAGKKD